jgi:hypothetical protein
MPSRQPYDPGPYDDDWEDQPAQSPFHQWVLGLLLPLLLAGYGIYGIANQQIEFGGRVLATFRGLNATALGVAAIAAGLFVHCHYFWGNIYDQAWFAVLGKIVAACVFIAGLVFLLIRNGVLGIG